MGYIAKNWTYTFDKNPNKIDYQIYSRAYPWLSPFRWHGQNVVDGPEKMEIDHPHFWNWIETFKPGVILFQELGSAVLLDQNVLVVYVGLNIVGTRSNEPTKVGEFSVLLRPNRRSRQDEGYSRQPDRAF